MIDNRIRACSIHSCPGESAERDIADVLKHHSEVIVFENVMAEVRSVCGDALLALNKVQAMESHLKHLGVTR